MVQRMKRQGDAIPHAADLLEAMGQFRRRVIDASTEVRPFGAAYYALSTVAAAIDSLATFMTGQRDHFALKPHSRPPGDERYVVLKDTDKGEA